MVAGGSQLWFAAAFILAMLYLASAGNTISEAARSPELAYTAVWKCTGGLSATSKYFLCATQRGKGWNGISSVILQVMGMHSGLVASLSSLEGKMFETLSR